MMSTIMAAATFCCLSGPPVPATLAPVHIAPGVAMPVISNGAITNGSWFPNNTLELPGIEEWFRQGGRGVDTAWCYHNQPQVGAAIASTNVPRGDIFITTKVRARTQMHMQPAC